MRKLLALLLAALTVLAMVSCAVAPETENGNEADASAPVATLDDLQAVASTAEMNAVAIDDAYIRGGTNGDTNYLSQKQAEGVLELKQDIDSYRRDALLKFDISKMDLRTARSVYLNLNFVTGGGVTKTGNDLYIFVYSISNDWNSATVTYNSAPTYDEEKDFVAKEFVPGEGGVCSVDISDAIFDAYDAGETIVSIRLVMSEQTNSQGKLASVSNENHHVRPKIVIRNSDPNSTHETQILSDKAANDALWAYAQQIYDDWYGRYQEILARGDYDYDSVVSNADEYNTVVMARGGNGSKEYHNFDTRLVSDLEGYEEKIYEVDRYGGALVSEKHEATGYYYTKKIGDRWWVIDPLGNLVHIHGTSHFKYAYISTAEVQKASALRVFGSYQKWAIAATRWAMEELGFNVAHSVANEARDVELSMPITGSFSGINAYSNSVGLIIPNGGGVPQFAGGAMPVFDPAFETYVEASVIKQVALYEGRTDVIGYISDNEVLIKDTMLASYLTVDYSSSLFQYTYACAWTWYKNITGQENPAAKDIDKYCDELGVDLWDLFKGFVYDRYYKVCSETLDKYDPNRMYFGNRFLIDCKKWEWICRFTGYWCDVMCINYYHVWEIPTSREDKIGTPTLDQLGAWLGKPFVITEFYSKGNDAVDANGTPMDNNGGAGWVVENQKDRGYFYQNFTLKLLQCKHCVGWFQFQFIDNDPTDPIGSPAAAQSSNKGLVDWNQDFEIYSDFTEQLAMLNKNTYALIEYFDGVTYIK